MYRPHWIQFSWDVTRLPEEAPAHLVSSAELRRAGEDDVAGVWAVVERAYSTELAWGATMTERLEELKDIVHDGIEEKEKSFEFMVLEHGRRIIAVCGLLLDAEAPRQLTTGICVLEEYRCRGAGANLLYHSLKRLRDKELKEAKVVTKSNVPAARHLYTKFGSQSLKVDDFPGLKQLK